MPAHLPDTIALGDLIYTRYIFVFELTALLLLIAMIGAIVLTHSARPAGPGGPRRQDVTAQHDRRLADTFSVVQVQIGAGATIPDAPADAPPAIAGPVSPRPAAPSKEIV
jgi:NADH-quinone oxidoreductase subunit J